MPLFPKTLLAGMLVALTTSLLAAPTLPNIHTNNVVVVTDYGAVGNGITNNTAAIQTAINTAAAGATTNGAAGGTVRVPAGVFLCGPLTLKSSVNLQLDAGASPADRPAAWMWLLYAALGLLFFETFLAWRLGYRG